MLLELRISNFALIEQLHIEFSPGFIALTGETGAGKSLLIDALSVLLGGRASPEYIRPGAQETALEALFSLPSSGALVDRLKDADLMGDDPGLLVLRRILSRSGRNRAYINGHLAPLQTVQTFAPFLIDFHGQHEQQSLLSPAFQLSVLDEFAGLQDLRTRYREARAAWIQKQDALNEAQSRFAELQREHELVTFQFHELSHAQLDNEAEEASLTAEYTRLHHAEKIAAMAEHAYQLLYEADGAILEQLRHVGHSLKEIAALDPRTAEWMSLEDEASVQLRGLAEELRNYRHTIEYDAQRLRAIDERLATLHHLKHKYQTTLPGLIELRDHLRHRLNEWEEGHLRMEALHTEVAEAQRKASDLARELSKRRKAAAKTFERQVLQELRSLAMEHIMFTIAIDSETSDDRLGPMGQDRIEYLLSVNPGSPMQSLSKVASGGELSRIMLALKTVLAASDTIPTLIFDEIDVGVGGAVAALMGKRLRALAQYHQVLCVTHLPQIASQADQHFSVTKHHEPDRTAIRVVPLTGTARQDEIARMLGGLEITRSVRQSAAEMLESGIRAKRHVR